MNVFVYKWTPKFSELCDKCNGCEVTSPIFHTMANNTFMFWKIDFYPNGRRPLCLDRSSIFLRLAGTSSGVNKTVQARFKFELITTVTESPTSIFRTCMSENHDFRSEHINATSLCFHRFTTNMSSMNKKELLLLGDERVLIKCTIEMSRKLFTSQSLIVDTNYITRSPQVTPSSKVKVEDSFLANVFNLPDVAVVTTDDKQFYCHGIILSEKCSYFKHLLDLADSSTELPDVTIAPNDPDNNFRRFTLQNVESDAFTEIVRFIYFDSFDSEKLRPIANKVLPVAELYVLTILKTKCVELMTESVEKTNAAEFLVLADKHCKGDDRLKRRSITVIVDELKDVKDESGWKTFVTAHPHLVDLIFEEVAAHNVLAAF